jgi:hypothetical protein
MAKTVTFIKRFTKKLNFYFFQLIVDVSFGKSFYG